MPFASILKPPPIWMRLTGRLRLLAEKSLQTTGRTACGKLLVLSLPSQSAGLWLTKIVYSKMMYGHLFRRSQVIYRVLFEVVETDEDASYIHILHIRHASRKPMTWAEAREIDQGE